MGTNYEQADEDMRLPEGKTCANCFHFSRCKWLVGAKDNWNVCDFGPSKFHDNALMESLKDKNTLSYWRSN